MCNVSGQIIDETSSGNSGLTLLAASHLSHACAGFKNTNSNHALNLGGNVVFTRTWFSRLNVVIR